MARLNRSSLPFIGLLVALGAASNNGCSFDTHGAPPDNTTTGGMGGVGGAGGDGMVGGMAGFGGGMVCKPGSPKACYTGPAENANIGNCKPGSQMCLADGSGYDTCTGDVLPALEDCATVGDEDCDGLSDVEDSECKCTPGQMFPCDTGLMGVCATGTGLCSADGKSFDTCVQDKQPSPENCATDMVDDDCDGTFAPKCSGSPKGTYAPAGSSAMPNDDAVFSVAYTSDGGYVIAGMTDGTIGADGFGVTAGKAYVAKFDAAQALQWQKKFDTTTYSVVRGVAVDKDGNVIIAGSFNGSMMLDSTTLVSDAVDIFLIKLDSLSGAVVWSKLIQAAKTQNAFGVAVDSMANIYVTGSTDNAIDFGDGSQMVTGTDFFIVSYGADNAYRWGKILKSAGNQFGRAIATTTNGDVLVTGDTNDVTDLGKGDIMKDKSVDIFVARYSGSNGTPAWGKLFGKATDQFGRGIGVAPDGNVLITGGFAGTVDWKTGTSMTALGSSDVFVAKLDGTTGDYLAHTQGGKSGTSVGSSIAADAAGNIAVFGYFSSTIDFGGQQGTSLGMNDTFLVKLNPTDLKPIWTKTYGKLGNQYGWSVAVTNDGSAIVGGEFYTEFEVLPAAPVPSTGGADRFAVLVNP